MMLGRIPPDVQGLCNGRPGHGRAVRTVGTLGLCRSRKDCGAAGRTRSFAYWTFVPYSFAEQARTLAASRRYTASVIGTRTPAPDPALLASYIASFTEAPPPILSLPGRNTVQLAVSPIGDRGGVVALSDRPDLPSEIDPLLGTAANQAAIALERGRLLAQREDALAGSGSTVRGTEHNQPRWPDTDQ